MTSEALPSNDREARLDRAASLLVAGILRRAAERISLEQCAVLTPSCALSSRAAESPPATDIR